MKEYLYDVYLSFTGADRELKNDIRARLDEIGFSSYDSDEYCMGQFRQNYMEALDKSRVFLMILSDNLRNDPAITQKGTLTEVRKELLYATELEAHNELNIIILTLSEFFAYKDSFHDYNDTIGWLFYSNTRGFSNVYGVLENELLSVKSFDEIASRVRTFIEKRKAGTPIISQAPKMEITSEKITSHVKLVGREREINAVLEAFRSGSQTVALYGLGGMGKTALATEIARKCNDEGLLVCPQIVHIQELGGSAGALHTVVSSVSYDKAVYDGLAYLAERDKYERKLKALSDLQENVLLVIDNYNDISEDDIEDIVSKLKCRILITTRSSAALRSDCCTAVKIECLSESEAKTMFDGLLGTQSKDEDFAALYAYTGGHTITLCIMAKIIATHGMSTAELIGKLDSLEDISAKVEFRHNEYGAGDTVLGHLTKLFSISNFSPEALRALKFASLLSDGIIKTADFARVLNYGNRNAIIELTKTGWLAEDADRLYLHPMISHLCAKTLLPSRTECAPMLSYILEKAKSERENITYSDLAISSENLYYAVYVIAASSGELVEDVWCEFVLTCRLIADADEAKRRADALLPFLKSDLDRASVTSFADMAVIDANPTKIEILDKYLSDLLESSDDYKWVMRALSVTVNHLSGIKETEEKLHDIILSATGHAVRRNDTLALIDLLTFSLSVENRRDIMAQMGKYISERRGKGENDGMLCNLELLYTYARSSKAKGAAEVLEQATRLVETVLSGNPLKYIGINLRHPIFMHSLNKTLKAIDALDESDPMNFYFEALFNSSADMLELGELNVKTMIDAVIRLHSMRLERGMTLSSAANAVAGFLTYLSRLPIVLVSDELNTLTEGIVQSDVSVKALSNLHVAMLVNLAIGNKNALEQSHQMLKLVERIRPIGHPDIIDARITYANNCAVFGEKSVARDTYREVIAQMSDTVGKSSLLSVIAQNLIDLIDAADTDIAEISLLFSLATAELTPDRLNYQKIFNKYATVITDIYRADEGAKEAMSKAVDMIRTMAKNKKSLPIASQNWLISTTHTCAARIWQRDRRVSDELGEVLKKLSTGLRSKLSAKAAGLHAELTNGLKMMDASALDEKIKAMHDTIAVITKKRVLKETASSKFTYILYLLKGEKSPAANTRELTEAIIADKPSEELCARVDRILNERIAFSDQYTEQEQADLRMKVLCDIMHSVASELCRNCFSIDEKEYRRIKRPSDFCRKALEATLAVIEERSEKQPYKINKRIPKIIRNTQTNALPTKNG